MMHIESIPGVSFLTADDADQCSFEFALPMQDAERYEIKPVPIDTLKRDTKRIGDISEMQVAAAFSRRGYFVCRPFGENQRYDLIIDDGEQLSRVQVKTGRLRNGVILYGAVSTHGHRGRPSKPYIGQIELLAVYCPDTEKVYVVPESHLTRSLGSLRIAPPKNNMSKTIRWASDYELA